MWRYVALLAGYATACLLLWAAGRRSQALWPSAEPDVGGVAPVWHALLILSGVVILGQLYGRGWFFFEKGSMRETARVVNQVLIFLPVFARVAMALHQGRARAVAFVPSDRIPLRLAVGCASATAAVLVYLVVLPNSASLASVAAGLFSPHNVAYLVQILGEDLGIGLLLASLSRRVSPRRAIIGTAILFAAGHLPSMFARGDPGMEFLHLVGDAGLAALAVALVFRLRDIWVFWPVHVAMDLMQFYGGDVRPQ